MTLDDEGLGIDPSRGELYWNGKPIAVRKAVTLEGWALAAAITGALAALVAAGWPIVQFLWLKG